MLLYIIIVLSYPIAVGETVRKYTVTFQKLVKHIVKQKMLVLNNEKYYMFMMKTFPFWNTSVGGIKESVKKHLTV